MVSFSLIIPVGNKKIVNKTQPKGKHFIFSKSKMKESIYPPLVVTGCQCYVSIIVLGVGKMVRWRQDSAPQWGKTSSSDLKKWSLQTAVSPVTEINSWLSRSSQENWELQEDMRRKKLIKEKDQSLEIQGWSPEILYFSNIQLSRLEFVHLFQALIHPHGITFALEMVQDDCPVVVISPMSHEIRQAKWGHGSTSSLWKTARF